MGKYTAEFHKDRPSEADRTIFEKVLEEFNAQTARSKFRVPYVLLGHIARDIKTDRDPEVMFTPMLHKLQVGTIHGTSMDLQRYTDRGWVVLDYWLPEPEKAPNGITRGDITVKSGWGLDWRTDEGKKRIAGLKSAILKAKGESDRLFGFQERENSLQAKLTAAKEEAEKEKAARMDLEARFTGQLPKKGKEQ